MYALSILDCSSFESALCLRHMLEKDGMPAVAATVYVNGVDVHFTTTSAPVGWAERLVPLAESFAATRGGLDAIKNSKHGESKLAVPAVVRDKVRNALIHAVRYTTAGELVQSEPASESTLVETATPIVNHDPGDEHKPVINPNGGGWDGRCEEDDEPTQPAAPVYNPRGGGWDGRCGPDAVDRYDGWKSAR